MPAFPRQRPPRDTNRAGESYAATLLSTLLDHGWNAGSGVVDDGLIRTAARRASAAAALELDRVDFGFPTDAEIDAALRPAAWRETNVPFAGNAAASCQAPCQYPLNGRDWDLGHQVTVVRALCISGRHSRNFPLPWLVMGKTCSFLLRIEVGSWTLRHQPQLAELLVDREAPCLSLYQPTHRSHPVNQQDPIRFRNLVKTLEDSLRLKHPTHEQRQLLARFHHLAEDGGFWRHTYDGLAIFGGTSFFRVFKLQRPVDELAIVANTFHTKPLVRIVQSADRYQVLAAEPQGISPV